MHPCALSKRGITQTSSIFGLCSELTTVIFGVGNGLEEIGKYAFSHTSLVRIDIKPQRQDNQGMGILLLQAVDDLNSRQLAGGDWEVCI